MAFDENGNPYGGDTIDYPDIYLKQAGGKYCDFTCPSCGWPKARMKMSANHGWCDKCELQFQMMTQMPANQINFYCGLEVIGSIKKAT